MIEAHRPLIARLLAHGGGVMAGRLPAEPEREPERDLEEEWGRLERIVEKLIARPMGEQSFSDVLRQCEERLRSFGDQPKDWHDWLAAFAYIGMLEAYSRVLAKRN